MAPDLIPLEQRTLRDTADTRFAWIEVWSSGNKRYMPVYYLYKSGKGKWRLWRWDETKDMYKRAPNGPNDKDFQSDGELV